MLGVGDTWRGDGVDLTLYQGRPRRWLGHLTLSFRLLNKASDTLNTSFSSTDMSAIDNNNTRLTIRAASAANNGHTMQCK